MYVCTTTATKECLEGECKSVLVSPSNHNVQNSLNERSNTLASPGRCGCLMIFKTTLFLTIGQSQRYSLTKWWRSLLNPSDTINRCTEWIGVKKKFSGNLGCVHWLSMTKPPTLPLITDSYWPLRGPLPKKKWLVDDPPNAIRAKASHEKQWLQHMPV